MTYYFNSIITKYQRWVECYVNRMDDNESFLISIYRDKETLSHLYLGFQRLQNAPILCFVPLTTKVKVYVNNTQMMLSFDDYSVSVIFLMMNQKMFEEILSEFCFALQNPQTMKDNFFSMNSGFLNSIHSDETFVSAAIESQMVTPLKPNYALLTPIVKNQNLLKMWKERIFAINSGFATEFRDLRVTFLTWNVASVRPNETVFDELDRVFSNGSSFPDIIFISLQEIDMGVVSVVAGSSKKVKDQWTSVIYNAVDRYNKNNDNHGNKPKYSVAATSCLGGVYAALIFRTNVEGIPNPICGEVKTIRLGALGLAANKGACVFPVSVGAAKFIFIGCHLTAGSSSENLEERNQQLRQLMRQYEGTYDYFLIVGDLNYRINLSYENCISLIEQNKIKDLLDNDQLRSIRKKDQDISRLKEPDQTFMPTYKFDPNSDIYDTSQKHRVPSYTDRILLRRGRKRLSVGNMDSPSFSIGKKSSLNFPSMPICVDFNRGTCKFSDHRSVLTGYKFKIPNVIGKKLKELQEQAEKHTKEIFENLKAEITITPKEIILDQTPIDLQHIKVQLKNVKNSWAFWNVETPANVFVSPSQGMILPNSTEDITVKINSPNQNNIKVTIRFHVNETFITSLVITNDKSFVEQQINQEQLLNSKSNQFQQRTDEIQNVANSFDSSKPQKTECDPVLTSTTQIPVIDQPTAQNQNNNKIVDLFDLLDSNSTNVVQQPIIQPTQSTQNQTAQMMTPAEQHQLFQRTNSPFSNNNVFASSNSNQSQTQNLDLFSLGNNDPFEAASSTPSTSQNISGYNTGNNDPFAASSNNLSKQQNADPFNLGNNDPFTASSNNQTIISNIDPFQAAANNQSFTTSNHNPFNPTNQRQNNPKEDDLLSF